MTSGESGRFLKEGFREARLLTKRYAKTFYFASRFMSGAKRDACYAVYAICRISDQSVDGESFQSDYQKSLNEVRRNIYKSYEGDDLGDALLSAFRATVLKYGIPRQFFEELLSGMQMDLDKNSYSDFSQLYDYCYKAAGVVGLIMLKIFASPDRAAEKYAKDLGIAMQLTNILRDIREDYDRGRIYIPRDEMKQFGVTDTQIAERKVDKNFIKLMKFQIERARSYYKSSENGISLLPDRNSRMVVSVMKEAYSGILNSIERAGYDIFSRRAYVNSFKKTALVFKVFLNGKNL